ncbi:hypothetical protein PPL_00875 [Heterostelium album PN500]|uniref:Ankyrin repeat protein n=1 Tax=Heterostelium pallidum (strain ATCC 26659 / Pp 5 / PN500) TaxID=670386 RepID=D3AYV6_HETP5|nr:hypothetical protein PPL_00875 [Heterostelium album PN500]EFA85646.1 hypothetical protein PPL_00875 [Heterostelium album PN500]|eukprot:XP_020437753.1 hypothetical protein PPL_00875 [Heterostelium album PN500]
MYHTLIHNACNSSNIEVLAFLEELRLPFEFISFWCDRLLAQAACTGNLEVIKFFCERRYVSNITHLMNLSIGKGYLNIIKWVCEEEPPATMTWSLNMVLFEAASNEKVDAVKYLLEYINNNHGNKETIKLSKWMFQLKNFEIFKLLYLHTTKGHGRCSQQMLRLVIGYQRLDIIELLYENNKNPMSDPFKRYKPNLFYHIIVSKNLEILQFFIKVRDQICYYSLMIMALKLNRFSMLSYIYSQRNNNNRKQYTDTEIIHFKDKLVLEIQQQKDKLNKSEDVLYLEELFDEIAKSFN